ncbi:hypothetical protein [Francisella philomiragia]|uniref:hypothetical protein n=1 Tax=Francisella philomiragia TaxID=28110 RepID=UPI003516C158
MNYIHIGYPKCLSTSLQVDFFSKHSQLDHLGIGYNGENLKYRSSILNVYLEALLKARDIEFTHIHNNLFKTICDEITSSSGISHENLSFRFSNEDVDISQKVDRLYSLFGNETKIIVIIRNQAALLKSLYKESLKTGLAIDYCDYINTLYRNKFHSYLNDFKYDTIIDYFSNKFDSKNILILPIESYLRDKSLIKNQSKYSLLQEICSFLNIKYETIVLNTNNVSINDIEAYHLLELNKKYRYNLNKGSYSLVDIHKYKNVFDYIEYDESDIYFDVKLKRLLVENAKEKAKTDFREIDYYADPIILSKIKNMYIESNKRLQNKYGIALPDSYFEVSFK